MPRTIEDYIKLKDDSCDWIIWLGGRLKPFLMTENKYQWVLFPIELEPGYYQIALMINPPLNSKPISAYAVAFPPDATIYDSCPIKYAGLGFHTTPAIASGNTFMIVRNVCKFNTIYKGVHTIGVTTRDWVSDVEKVSFEFTVLKERKKYLYK
ncbi:MAG TPA: hypothetical protein G4N92_08685 [Anaerolineae bacterium]|nr:hypothetical protein [Anaerolineae bacterium]